MNRNELLKVLESQKIVGLKFIKRSTGEVRTMSARIGVVKNIVGTGKSFSDEEKQLVTVWDMNASGYRSVPCENVLEVKANGEVVWAK